MKKPTNLFRQWLLLPLLLLSMPSSLMADEMVVADAGGNELRYTFDGSDGPATLAGVVQVVNTDVVVANQVTDGSGNSHVVKAVGRNAFYGKTTITSITFGGAMRTVCTSWQTSLPR